jgi:tyrosinase
MAERVTGNVPLRRAVSTLDRSRGKPQELRDYADGIQALKSQPEGSQLSLDYLASMHGTDNNPKRNPDFNMCQHQSWFFLPWHRMYLRQFEKIICDLIGKPDWRLPYWDYTSGVVSLPAEFLEPAADSNPLYVSGRVASAVRLEHVDATALAAADAEPIFAAADPLPDFGSAIFPRPMQHAGPDGHFGVLEGGVHNNVHVDVGGMMADPNTAAWDPIFWLHHANVDRLWEVWLNVDTSHQNSADPIWLNTKFAFPDTSGRTTFLIKDVFDTQALGYAYDDTTPPTGPAPHEQERLRLLAPELRTLSFESSSQPELIGASDVNLALDSGAVHVVFTDAAFGLAVRSQLANEPRTAGRSRAARGSCRTCPRPPRSSATARRYRN